MVSFSTRKAFLYYLYKEATKYWSNYWFVHNYKLPQSFHQPETIKRFKLISNKNQKQTEPLQICRQKLEDKTENQNEQEAVMIFIQIDIVKIFIG